MSGEVTPTVLRLAETLISRERITSRVREMGLALASELAIVSAGEPGAEKQGGRVVLMPVMTGALVFCADLIREMPITMRLGLVTVSSYPGAAITSKGAMLRSQIPHDLAGAHVVIVDDILDSGQTLSLVHSTILEQVPASVRSAVLLRKPASVRKTPFEAEHVGFDIPNDFVVGYGLDHDGEFRNLPHIAVLRPVEKHTS